MRYLQRTHRVSVAWLHERFKEVQELQLLYTTSGRMCADIYTKAFSDPEKWRHACDLINIFVRGRLHEVVASHDVIPPTTDNQDTGPVSYTHLTLPTNR